MIKSTVGMEGGLTGRAANNTLKQLGFSFKRGDVHTARPMMLAELRALLSRTSAPASYHRRKTWMANWCRKSCTRGRPVWGAQSGDLKQGVEALA